MGVGGETGFGKKLWSLDRPPLQSWRRGTQLNHSNLVGVWEKETLHLSPWCMTGEHWSCQSSSSYKQGNKHWGQMVWSEKRSQRTPPWNSQFFTGKDQEPAHLLLDPRVGTTDGIYVWTLQACQGPQQQEANGNVVEGFRPRVTRSLKGLP